MRKTITAAVAATILGLGVQSVHASASPTEAAFLVTPYVVANAADSNPEVGAELAGLAHAYSIGVTTPGLQTKINNLADGIVAREALSSPANSYYGDEAYGIAYAAQVGALTTSTDVLAVAAYYSPLTAPSAMSIASHTGAGDYTTTDNYGLYQLSYTVLATNLLGSPTASSYVTGLASALGQYNTTNNLTYSSIDDPAGLGQPDTAEPLYQGTTEDLALAVYALAKAGFTGTTDGVAPTATNPFAHETLAGLKGLLTTDLDAELSGTTYTQDLTYGVLALEALGDTAAATTYLNALTALVGPTAAGPVPNSTLYTRANVEDAGVALQALPEPATLSLIGFGGMALLARRRRLA